jgi:hypothetical protein
VTDRLLKQVVRAVGEAASVGPSRNRIWKSPQADEYARSHPQAQDVLLLIEVADDSLAFDQGAKLRWEQGVVNKLGPGGVRSSRPPRGDKGHRGAWSPASSPSTRPTTTFLIDDESARARQLGCEVVTLPLAATLSAKESTSADSDLAP